MSTEVTRMLSEIKRATTTAYGGGLLTEMVRERLVLGGADTMGLSGACVDLRSAAIVARFDGHADLTTTLEAEADEFSTFELAIVRAGRWLNALGEHPSCARNWLEAVECLASGLNSAKLWHLADPGGWDEIASFDLAARIAFTQIDLSSIVEERWSGAVEAAGRFDDGWLTVSGRIYGDPRFGEGQFVTFSGLPAPVLKTMRGSHMICDLGRPGSPP